MREFAKLLVALGPVWMACSSETAIVATLDAQGGMVATSGGKSNAVATGGAAGAIQSGAGGSRQESGGASVQSGGLVSSGGTSGGAGASAGTSGGDVQTGGREAMSGGAPVGGAGGGDGGDGGAPTRRFCSCMESQSVCGSDGETHVCFGEECPPIMILCLHACPCGGEINSPDQEVWYPEACFDPNSCASSSLCVEQEPKGVLISNCPSSQDGR